MKFIRVFLFALFFMPMVSHAASNEFIVAAQLLAAAKNADIQQVQILINNGANVNYVDSTGLSIVCTALMNNDVRAAQILQMYGADASNCDRQIKRYNNQNKPADSGGMFGGLSSAQSITLTAAGAAVIVGGLFLLTDWLDPGNDNESSSSGGSGGSSGGGSSSSDSIAFTLPAGPASLATGYDYDTALDYYSPSDTSSILYDNFKLMNRLLATQTGAETYTGGQNYMLMMHGYSPLARGYLGQRTLRNTSTRAPFALVDSTGEYLYEFDGEYVQGGTPVNVALVTANGVNAAVGTSLGEYDETLDRFDFILYSTVNGNTVNPASNSMVFSKFYNNVITLDGNTTTLSGDDTISEDASRLSMFDLAGYGTVIHNPDTTNSDTMLAKIVGGRDAGYSTADYFGFMPNGQMTIFRTGGGFGLLAATNDYSGTYTTIAAGKTLELTGLGLTLTLDTVTDNTTTGGIVSFVATDTSDNEYAGYIGTDGKLYIDSNADGDIDEAYTMDAGTLTLVKERGAMDYANYDALIQGAYWARNGNINSGQTKPEVLANAAMVPGLRLNSAKTVGDMMSAGFNESTFESWINDTYGSSVGAKAGVFFEGLGSYYSPLVVFSTGAWETDSDYSGESRKATFENAAPLVFDDLNHLFMSVVAIGTTDGTANVGSVTGYVPGGYALSQWVDTSGTEPAYYKSRICGIAGTGNGGDPWCFAAAGVTDEMAVASAAGAVGAVKSAFSYLTNDEIFVLLALTADGPYLDSSAYAGQTLAGYLGGLYTLPDEYENNNTMDYIDKFKEVFGYGMINLARATTPAKSVYRYDGTGIVADGAYWRAATNTAFHTSSALTLRAASLTTAAYDVLQSSDGSMVLPRIWESTFAIGNSGRRGLYMGDVLGELKTRRDDATDTKIGNMSFHLARSERAYYDNMNGLDELRMAFDMGAWHMSADYQHHLTDGTSRFSGMSNPILGMASNAVTTNVEYGFGNWIFGARAFSGAITDDGLLETDPTISAQFMPATLGFVNGAQSSAGWGDDKFSVMASVGFMRETNTLLGAQTDGLLGLGTGDTQYVDAELRYSPFENVSFKMRGTYAKTNTTADGSFITDVSSIESNAFAFGADVGNFSFAIARPLAAYNGAMKYAYADYAIVENGNGIYGIDVVDAGVKNLKFGSDMRELRFSGEYRHHFGEFTDGAFGFIYRVNPNNTDEFGDESIFLLKLSHRVGI